MLFELIALAIGFGVLWVEIRRRNSYRTADHQPSEWSEVDEEWEDYSPKRRNKKEKHRPVPHWRSLYPDRDRTRLDSRLRAELAKQREELEHMANNSPDGYFINNLSMNKASDYVKVSKETNTDIMDEIDNVFTPPWPLLKSTTPQDSESRRLIDEIRKLIKLEKDAEGILYTYKGRTTTIQLPKNLGEKVEDIVLRLYEKEELLILLQILKEGLRTFPFGKGIYVPMAILCLSHGYRLTPHNGFIDETNYPLFACKYARHYLPWSYFIKIAWFFMDMGYDKTIETYSVYYYSQKEDDETYRKGLKFLYGVPEYIPEIPLIMFMEGFRSKNDHSTEDLDDFSYLSRLEGTPRSDAIWQAARSRVATVDFISYGRRLNKIYEFYVGILSIRNFIHKS